MLFIDLENYKWWFTICDRKQLEVNVTSIVQDTALEWSIFTDPEDVLLEKWASGENGIFGN